MKKLEDAEKIKITTPAGTELSLSVKNRPFFTDTMMDWKLMKWMNLPTGEVIVAPVEDSLEGTLVSDVAVGGIGPLTEPVVVSVKDGRAETIECADDEVLERIGNSFNTDAMAGVVGEFAFGINPKARLIEEFLETEKMFRHCSHSVWRQHGHARWTKHVGEPYGFDDGVPDSGRY